jgi:hypothetical protein
MLDTDYMMKTHGSWKVNHLDIKDHMDLNQYMAIDSLGTTNSVWTKRRYAEFDNYKTSEYIRKQRLLQMAQAQQNINNMMFMSPIGHYRM